MKVRLNGDVSTSAAISIIANKIFKLIIYEKCLYLNNKIDYEIILIEQLN